MNLRECDSGKIIFRFQIKTYSRFHILPDIHL